MKLYINTILLFIAFLWNGNLHAQISTVSGFNYYDINNNAFTVDATCFGLSASETEEYEYRFTSIQLANELNSIFSSASDSIDQVVGDYKLMKRSYLNQSLGGENFRYIMIRPNDTITRPIILITHGGKSGGINPLRTLTLGLYDYVQRGYAVAFYQSGTATGNNIQALADAGFTNPCHYDWSPDESMDCFQQAVYIKHQFAVAARDYTTANKNNLFIDESLMFASGYSGGSIGSLYLGLSDAGNFTDPLFSGMGGFNNLSRFPTENATIKGIATLAGGIVDQTSTDYKIGNLLDASDQNTRYLLLHGQDDYAIQPLTNPLHWSDPVNELPGSQLAGSISLDEMFKLNNIESKAIINCSACHNLYTWPCDYNDDCLGNNPIFDFDCALWALNSNYITIDFSDLCAVSNDQSNWTEIFYVLDQIHDYGKIISAFVHEDFPASGPSKVPDTFLDAIYANDEVYALNPSDFPFDKIAGNVNGHYAPSTKCLVQNCSALFFNELGNSNLFGSNYKGDYLTMTGLSQSTFNNDFTLELQIKAIDQNGIGVLFSHIDNLTLGFELFINNNGFVQFKKNALSGQGSITGDIDVLDDSCHIISLTREGNEFGLYVDGILQETKKNYNLNFNSNIDSRIGNTLNEVIINRGFNGIVRNIVLWNSAVSNLGQVSISIAEIDLIAEWQLNQGFGYSFSSTNGDYPILLGEVVSDSEFDPRWMRDDEICSCFTDAVVGVQTTEQGNLEPMAIVYPNPNNGQFTLELSDQLNLPSHLTIHSIDGVLIQQIAIHTSVSNFSQFSKGVYLLQLHYEDRIMTLKVIVR